MARRAAIDPLRPILMPSHGVSIGLTAGNSWLLQASGELMRMAYVATDSKERFSLAVLQSATRPRQVTQVFSRPALDEALPHGVVIELHLSEDLKEEDQVQIALAQAGATTYFPPQQIDDLPEG